MNQQVNPQMIILAREARGLTQAELAEKIGMSPTNLSKIERSEIGINTDVITAISDSTDFPAHFFLQPGKPVPEHLNYRQRETVAQKLITPIHAQVNIIRRHIQFLTAALDVQPPVLPAIEVTDTCSPAQIALQVRQQWGVTTPVIDNLTALLEANGIFVSSFSFGTPRVDSRSILTDDRHPVIFINRDQEGDRQRFSLAYQLGQLIMHTFVPVHPQRDVGHEANEFAAEFLMPAALIKDDLSAGITIPILGELKRKWKVSMIALLYRADDLGLITPNQKRYLIQQFNKLNIRRREPVELDIEKEQPALAKQLITDFKNRTKLSTADMAALFCINIDEYLDLHY